MSKEHFWGITHQAGALPAADTSDQYFSWVWFSPIPQEEIQLWVLADVFTWQDISKFLVNLQMNCKNNEIGLFALIFCLCLSTKWVPMQTSLSNWSMVECFRVNAQGLVTENRREREFSRKKVKNNNSVWSCFAQRLQEKGSSSSSSSQPCQLRGKTQMKWSYPKIFSCEKDAWIWRRLLYHSVFE